MANLQLPLNQNHEVVLGSEYCSGYKDPISKEWNTGFYCPASDESEDVFCCGTSFRKYCCTKKDKVLQSEIQDLTILIGVIVGASAAILIITLVSCFCCSCCLLYKKRNSSSSNGKTLSGSIYRFQNASEHSGVTNMYSLSGGASRTGTPQINSSSGHYHRMIRENDVTSSNYRHRNGGMSHSHTLPHNLSHHGKNRHMDVDSIAREPNVRPYGTLGRLPRERPPPYHDLPSSAYLPPQHVTTASVVSEMIHHHIEEDAEGGVHSISRAVSDGKNHPPPQEMTGEIQQPQQIIFSNVTTDGEDEETLFHSTKF